jgi:hypothetical protein
MGLLREALTGLVREGKKELRIDDKVQLSRRKF